MDIRNIARLAPAYQEKINVSSSLNKNQKLSAGLPADEVVLSSQAQELNQTLKELKNYPDVRETKIREISEKINSGSYNIDSVQIAESLLNSSNFHSM